MRLVAAFLLIASLTACHGSDEDNIQARAEKDSAQLHQQYNALEAEATNGVNDQIGPIDNETANLLNQMNGSVPANGATGNGAAQP